MTVATVQEIWRYPVKSMVGESVDSLRFDETFAGDRTHGVFETTTGNVLSAKTTPALLEAAAARVDGEIVITLPSGATTGTADPDCDRILSDYLGRAVALRPAEAAAVSTIAMEVDEGEGPDDEERPVVEISTQPGWLFDGASPIHLIGAATLAALEDTQGPGAGDHRRFRPNIIVSGVDAWGENDWVDRTLRIGPGLETFMRKRTPRCVIIGRAQNGLPRDRALLRHVVREHDACVGLSCNPTNAALVSVGDAVGPI